MATAKIRVILKITFGVDHDQDNEENLLDWIVGNRILYDEFAIACYENMEVLEATYEEEEEEEEEEGK